MKNQKCDCAQCDKKDCIHREAYRRVPRIDGGLGLCPNLSQMTSKMDIKTIAEYMVKQGINRTNDYNYIFDTEKIAEEFNLSAGQIQENAEEILRQLDSRKEVAEYSYEDDGSFYITFYMDFCKNNTSSYGDID